MILIQNLIRLKNLKRSPRLMPGRMINLLPGEVGVEPRSLYDCAVSATASLTAKYVAWG
jgi:hypothetical protein